MSGPTRLAYQPALDGVRALAVAAVLLFHAEVPGFGGGYLGVSIFFTLSGYLITSLLLAEHRSTGSIDLGAFYGRRLRRLLPASALTVAAIVAIAALTDVFDAVQGLRAQVLGSIFQVANWVLLAGDSSYQELLAETSGTPSPLEHFWSLAIEEQFYWLWPACMLLLLGSFASRAARVRVLGGVTAGFMVAAPVIAQVWGPDAAYWATPARLSEILVGAFLAMVLADRTVPGRAGRLAPVALAGLGLAVVLFPPAGGPAYAGALPLVAVVSGLLLVGLQVDTPLRRLLSTRPFVGLGLISYGVYLYHWPVYVIVDADRLGADGVVLVVVRLAITLAISIASYVLVEQPIRRTRRAAFTPTAAGAGLATASIAVVALVALPATLGDYWQADGDAAEAAAIEVVDEPLVDDPSVEPAASTGTAIASGDPPATEVPPTEPSTVPPPEPDVDATAPAITSTTTAASTPDPTTTVPPIPELSRPMRVVVTGDSSAEALGTGVVGWASAHPDLAQAEVVAAPGCGFLTGGERARGDTAESYEACDGWVDQQLLPAVERAEPDVVVVMMTTWDLIGHRWDDGELIAPMDPEFRRRLDDAYAELVDEVVASGASRVAFVRQPVPNVWWLDGDQEENEPERHAVLYEIYADLAAREPDRVGVVAFDRWFTAQGHDEREDVRPDGVHLEPDAAVTVLDDYLGEQILRVALGMETQ